MFKVSVRNKGGWSSEESKWIQTPPGPPTGPPLNVKATAKTSSSILVTWDKPNSWMRNGPLGGYSVQYNLVTDKASTLITNITNPNETRMTLMNLKYYGEYEIRVRAFGAYGHGPFSVTVMRRTEEDGELLLLLLLFAVY